MPIGLEADHGLGHGGRLLRRHPPAQAGVAAGVLEALPELPQQDRGAQARAGGEPSPDMGQLGGRQVGRPPPRSIGGRHVARGVLPRGAPVKAELARERGDRPTAAVEHVQFHPDILRLHPIPPVRCPELRQPGA
jgi:hypothetical protein